MAVREKVGILTSGSMPPPGVVEVVQRYWGFDSLRPLQAEAIKAGLEGRDSLVVMPTGGGKSLCYQVPPLLSGRLCVVVSPLISLMQDQVAALRVAGYPAGALHGNIAYDESAQIRREVSAGSLKLLLVAPERLLSESFLAFLANLRGGVGSFAIDEAHCISQWGHDFRPEYRRLAELRRVFPGVPFHAYTATATPRVREDIVNQLGLREPAVLVGRFDRPNLTYRILPRVRVREQVAEALKRHDGRAAIVYCISRKDTVALAAGLSAMGVDARAYHAGLNADVRTKVAADFRAERLNVVVATVAFGMGIDRGDVRCVVHAAMPKTVEHYQQETGRAGRDGLPAECVLFYSAGDVMKWQQIMRMGAGEGEVSPKVLASQLELLGHMHRLAAGAKCRHRALSEYFGQDYIAGGGAGECGACDVCLKELDVVEDSMAVARKILSCVARVNGSFGAVHVVEVLRGQLTKRVVERRHNELSTFGLLRDVPKEALQSYINQLIDEGVLERAGIEYPVLRLNDLSWEVLRELRPVALVSPKHIPTGRGGRADAIPAVGDQPARPLSEAEDRLFEMLRVLRRQIAGELGVAPSMVFEETTLEEIARVRPGSRESLINIRGIGTVKLEQFGDRFVEAVRLHCDRHGLDLDAIAGSRPRNLRDRSGGPEVRHGGTRSISAAMFRDGMSIEEVARRMGIKPNTAADHLAEYISEARPESITRWVDEATYREVNGAIRAEDQRRLRPVFDRLGGRVPYDVIRLVARHREAMGA